MIRRTLLAFVVMTRLGSSASADDLSQTLFLSQRHHDPRGVWFKSRIRLTIDETRADGSSRTSLVVIDAPGSAFELKTRKDKRQIVISVFREKTSASLDGRLDFSKEDAAKYGLDEQGVLKRRNYYSYLYGLPMKLNDPGAIIGIPVPIARYEGRTYRKIRVTYDPKIGGDVWDFFFDPKTNALSGYRFFHDEAKGEGEFVTLAGEIECGLGLRIPKTRSWFTHKDRKALGTDTITACSAETP